MENAGSPLDPPGSPSPEPSARQKMQAAEHAKAADALYGRGQFAAALTHYRAAAGLEPRSHVYQFRCGCCAWDAGDRDLAQRHLGQAILLYPEDAPTREAMGQLAMELGDMDRALVESAAAAALVPDNPHIAVSRAMVLETAGQSAQAWEIVQRLRNAEFQSPRLALLMSRMAARMKQPTQALEMVQRALTARPPRRIDQIALNFAAANLLDSLAEYEQAFAHARQANALVGAFYDAADIEREIRDLISFFTPARLRRLPRATHGDERPTFIVGMPRSGTSLVEQILASHPAVHAGGELEAMFTLARQIAEHGMKRQLAFPFSLNLLSIDWANDLARQYLEPLAKSAGGASRITDKLPLNFLQLGLIAVLFPESRIIHCRRDARDTCLSCYMTHFATGNAFSYDLAACGHFYGQYERIMTHWQAALSVPILDVHYEQVVGNFEAEVRRIISFIGLPWDEACLRFDDNKRIVPTASNDQVRRPIYKSSIERWRHYEPWLGELNNPHPSKT